MLRIYAYTKNIMHSTYLNKKLFTQLNLMNNLEKELDIVTSGGSHLKFKDIIQFYTFFIGCFYEILSDSEVSAKL